MTGDKAPGLAQERARRVVRHLLGGGQLRSMLMVVAMLVGVGWLADSLFEWLTDIGNALEGRPVEDWLPLHRLIALSLFVAGFLHLYALARDARERYRPSVQTQAHPAQARGLILYLSNLRQEDENALRGRLEEITDIQTFRDRFGRANWRMPLEAIDYHLPRLSEVVLVCSSGESGSAGQVALFRQLLERCFPRSGLRIIDAGELEPKYRNGIDFEDVDRLAEVTDDAYDHLLSLRCRTWEILIDVTGGQKTNAIAGTAVALAEGRHIQYVSNRDYRVRVFDVSYEQ